MLNEALSCARKNLNNDEIRHDRKYHEKIMANFTQIIRSLGLVRDEVEAIHENGKTFDKLILNEETGTGILAEVAKAQTKWLEYSASMNDDVNLEQYREKPRRFYEEPKY